MKKIFALTALSLALSSMAVSCDEGDEYVPPTNYTIDWNAAADSATTALIQNYWNAEKGFFNAKSDSYHGETNNYWPQAHAMDVIIDAYLRTGDTKYSAMFDKWFEGIKTQCWSSRKNEYWVPLYDDNAWISCTMMRLYNVTKDTKYLEVARHLFEDMMESWNDEGVGGLPWGDPSNSAYGGPNNQATPTNGPACVLGFRLYEATQDQKYLDDALRIYNFLREYILDPATGRVLNGIDGQTLESTGEALSEYTYNHGTVMASAYAAYKHTGNALYLKDARRIASYAINKFSESSTNVLKYENNEWTWGGPDYGGDCALFRAIFFHYLADFIESPDFDKNWRNKFFASMNATADYLWRRGLADKSDYKFMLFANKFDEGVAVGEVGTLNCQVTACACIEMRARIANSLGK